MQRVAHRTLALAVTTLLTTSMSAAAQEYAGREKLRAQFPLPEKNARRNWSA
jgi:hypothetical protein